MDAISCYSTGSLCFPQKDWTKGQMTTRVHLLTGMYLLSIGAACNTPLYTLMSTFTRTLGESGEREP